MLSLTRGEQVGPYVLEYPLGAGGMSEVWAARHVTLGTLVALKLQGHAHRARLLREAAAAWAFPAGRAPLRAFEARGLPRPGPVEFLRR